MGDNLCGEWAFEDTHASYILLDGVALGDDTPRLARYLLEDFQHYASSRKPPDRRALLIVDEFSALRLPNAAVFVSGVVLAAIVVLSLLSGNSAGGTQPDRGDIEAVQTAADRSTPQQISDAWTQIKLGNAEPLTTIRQEVLLHYRSTHQEGDAIIIGFAGRHGGCVDLVSRPDMNRVRSRKC